MSDTSDFSFISLDVDEDASAGIVCPTQTEFTESFRASSPAKETTAPVSLPDLPPSKLPSSPVVQPPAVRKRRKLRPKKKQSIARLLAHPARVQAKVAQMAAAQAEAELSECTFKPQTL